MIALYNTQHKSVTSFRSKIAGAIFLLLIIFGMSSTALSQGSVPDENWTDNTAITMKARKWESGIIQPFRLGLNDRTELRSNAFLFPLLPNVGIKHSLLSGKSVSISFVHALGVPSVFMNAVSFKGTGGLISPQYSFPFIMTLSNSLLVTGRMGSSSLLTGEAGFAFALRRNKPDYQATIDIPFIYHRMAYFYQGAMINAGLSYKGALTTNLAFEEGVRIIMITRNSDNFFISNSGSLMWSSKGSLRVKGGYLLSWGKYPFGNHFQMWPSIDIIFGSKNYDQKQVL